MRQNKLLFTKPTEENIKYIFDHLSLTGKRDVDFSHPNSEVDINDFMNDNSSILECDGIPIGLVIIYVESEKYYLALYTTTYATENKFSTHRAAKTFLRLLLEKHEEIYTLARPNSDISNKWLYSLGFRVISNELFKGYHIMRLL